MQNRRVYIPVVDAKSRRELERLQPALRMRSLSVLFVASWATTSTAQSRAGVENAKVSDKRKI